MAVKFHFTATGWSVQICTTAGDETTVGSDNGTIDSIQFRNTNVAGELQIKAFASNEGGE